MRNVYSTPEGQVLVALEVNPDTFIPGKPERLLRFLRRFIPPYQNLQGNCLILMPSGLAELAPEGLGTFAPADAAIFVGFVEVEPETLDALFGPELTLAERPDDWE